MKKLFVLMVLLSVVGICSAFDTSALQLSIWAPKVQLVPDSISISGLKLNLPYGGNGKVVGVDCGLVSINKEVNADLTGEVSALQVNLYNSTAGQFSGFQVGLLNFSGDSSGLVIGLVNCTDNIAGGVTIGLVNTSLEYRGLEIGLVNYTQFMRGFQIGIINIATKSYVPFFPIINFCF